MVSDVEDAPKASLKRGNGQSLALEQLVVVLGVSQGVQPTKWSFTIPLSLQTWTAHWLHILHGMGGYLFLHDMVSCRQVVRNCRSSSYWGTTYDLFYSALVKSVILHFPFSFCRSSSKTGFTISFFSITGESQWYCASASLLWVDIFLVPQ